MIEFLRFPAKLTFALVAALMIGFHFHLETPRWAVMTAGIVAGGTAFVAGGDPYSGALRYRGVLRIIGTVIGCIAALTIMIATVRAPVVMLLLCCAWAGVCVWLSSLIKIENSYALGLAGYTALIIIISAYASGELTLTPKFAVERCSEIVLGILCAIVADMIFSPRSIKKVVEHEVEDLLVAHYRLLQHCVNGAAKEDVDKEWSALVRRTKALDAMRSQLKMESTHWKNTHRRLQVLSTLSLTMITQATESFLILLSHPDYVPSTFRLLLARDVKTVADVHKRMKVMRRLMRNMSDEQTPVTLASWGKAATEYLLLIGGIKNNSRITTQEEPILQRETVVQVSSAETHHAIINGIRTFVATALGSLFWLYTGWTSGSGCMLMLAVVTSLAMRAPNPLMMAKDFFYGMAVAVPLGAIYFIFILPSTQQSAMLLCIAIGMLGFVGGIFVQRRQLGTLGALVGTLNVLVLDNPMTFSFNSFLDSSLGQVIGCFLAMMVILLIRDKSQGRTGRKLLNRLMYAAVSAMTTNQARRRENHLPALYQQLFMLLNLFPGDLDKYRIALNLIIAHQRLRTAEVPVNADLSAFHRQLRHTADRVISARSDEKRREYFERLLAEFDVYQQKLQQYAAPASVTEPVRRLANMLGKYQSTLIQI